jgi:thiamine biosynthesis lipoprotein ApbE
VCATAGFAMGLAGAEWVAAQGLEAYQVQRDGRAVLTRGLAGVR